MKKIDKVSLKSEKKEHFYLKGKILLVLFVFQIIWISQFSEVSSDLVNTIINTYKNIGSTFSETLKDSSVKNALFRNLYIEGYTNKELYEYINENETLFTPLNPYSEQQTQKYSPKITNSEIIYSHNQYSTYPIFYVYQFIKYLIIISIVFGSIFIFFNKIYIVNKEFTFGIIISILLMFLIILLPYVSKAYNFERLFQQSLMFLSFSSIVFFQKIMKKFGSLFLFIAVLFYLGYSLFNMGFLLTFSGGVPTLNLYNTGFTYNSFYTHDEEISSINWLSKNYESGNVYMDPYSELKFFSFGNPKININNRVVPVFMNKLSYVYSSYSNTTKKLNFLDVRDKFNKGVISFNFPTDFLNENKNIVYNNGGCEVFK